MRERELLNSAGNLKKELDEFSKTIVEKKEVEASMTVTATCTSLFTVICC